MRAIQIRSPLRFLRAGEGELRVYISVPSESDGRKSLGTAWTVTPRPALARCEHGYWFQVEALDSLVAIDNRGAKVQVFVCGGKHDLALPSKEKPDVREKPASR